MNILALDLGTKCGWAATATNSTPMILQSGVWNLKAKPTESIGQRYRIFKNHLDEFKESDLIVYEEVLHHVAIQAAQIFGGFQALLQTYCLERNIEYKGVNVSTIKKHATGKGNAKKDDMICAASMKWPAINIISDDHADALWLLDYAIHNIK